MYRGGTKGQALMDKETEKLHTKQNCLQIEGHVYK